MESQQFISNLFCFSFVWVMFVQTANTITTDKGVFLLVELYLEMEIIRLQWSLVGSISRTLLSLFVCDEMFFIWNPFIL